MNKELRKDYIGEIRHRADRLKDNLRRDDYRITEDRFRDEEELEALEWALGELEKVTEYEYSCIRVRNDTNTIIGTQYWEDKASAEGDYKALSTGSKSTLYTYKLVKRRMAGEIEDADA